MLYMDKVVENHTDTYVIESLKLMIVVAKRQIKTVKIAYSNSKIESLLYKIEQLEEDISIYREEIRRIKRWSHWINYK